MILRNLLDREVLDFLKNGDNLLAFSYGVDSTALFFLLLDSKIEFDLAMVDYGIRDSSKLEVKSAKDLAKRYSKKIYIQRANLDIDSNFEANAREFRYDFFKRVVSERGYKNLILAHQLNDRLEWFLMQFTKGAGLFELLGFQKISYRDGYRLLRPLLNSTKDELESYLESNSKRYFIDESNFDLKFKRNYFRDRFSNSLISEFKSGVRDSFNFLEQDLKELDRFELLFQEREFYILKELESDILNIRFIDRVLKRLKVLLSKKQRTQILSSRDCVVSSKVAITFLEGKIFIAPYLRESMPKSFKESCRVFRIPPKVRSYLYSIGFENFSEFKILLKI